MTPTQAVLYGVVLVVLAHLGQRVRLGGRVAVPRWLTRLSVLLPSWRFFERPGRVARLEVRWGAAADELGRWHPIELDAPRPATVVLFNPHGNLALAERALLERLLADIDDAAEGPSPDAAADAIAESVDYRLVERLAHRKIGELSAAPALARQFRIVVRDAGTTDSDEVVVVSEVACP